MIQQRGFGILELMVAMTIGIFVSFGMLQIYQGTRNSARAQEGLSEIQEGARFAFDFLSRDIRMANFTGCVSQNFSNLTYHTTVVPQATLDVSSGISSASAGELVLLRPRGTGLTIETDLTTTNVSSLTVAYPSFSEAEAGDFAIVTDCENITPVQIDSVSETTASSSGGVIGEGVIGFSGNVDLGHTYAMGSIVYPVQRVRYFLQSNNLMREINGGTAEIITPDVSQLDFYFRTDNDSDCLFDSDDSDYASYPNASQETTWGAGMIPAGFKPAADVSDWDDVLSVLIVYTLRSSNAFVNVDGDDYLEQTFRQSVTLRNPRSCA